MRLEFLDVRGVEDLGLTGLGGRFQDLEVWCDEIRLQGLGCELQELTRY